MDNIEGRTEIFSLVEYLWVTKLIVEKSVIDSINNVDS